MKINTIFAGLLILCSALGASGEQDATPAAALVAPLVPPAQFTIALDEVTEPVAIIELGLLKAGFQAGTAFRKSDELRILSKDGNPVASPKARIWLRASGDEAHFWYRTGGEGLADHHVVEPGEKVVVRKRKGSKFTWKTAEESLP